MRIGQLMLANAIAYNLGVALITLGITLGIYLMVVTLNVALMYLLSHYPRNFT
ncbi:MAG: hypothetical protein QXJ48_06080 [Candidatus Korarchaeum sp.]